MNQEVCRTSQTSNQGCTFCLVRARRSRSSLDSTNEFFAKRDSSPSIRISIGQRSDAVLSFTTLPTNDVYWLDSKKPQNQKQTDWRLTRDRTQHSPSQHSPRMMWIWGFVVPRVSRKSLDRLKIDQGSDAALSFTTHTTNDVNLRLCRTQSESEIARPTGDWPGMGRSTLLHNTHHEWCEGECFVVLRARRKPLESSSLSASESSPLMIMTMIWKAEQSWFFTMH